MDWSTNNLGRLFQARQTIATSKDQAEIEKAKKEEKELLSNSKLFDLNNDGNVNIEDLVSFSTLNKDKDGNGEITDEEKNIFDSIKDTLYDTLAKNINKNKDLKVDDMLQLEKQIRKLDSAQKETIGKEMEKIQNRMVSNLTAQFFVTKETTSYKENAANGMIEIWEAQAGLDKLNESENNPFNNKLEVLLDKLESRATRTLSEDYTAASIKDAKNSKDISKLVKKTTEGDEDLDESKFFYDGTTKILKYNGELYTGYFGSSNPKKYYEEGKLLSGISMKYGKYFEDGLLANGVKDFTNTSGEKIGTCSVENGEIKYADLIDSPTTNNTVRTYYESYMTHELVDGVWKDKDASVINKVVTFVGTIETGKEDKEGKIGKIENYENGKIVSTETFEYNSDGSYTVEIKYTDSKKETEYIKHTTTGEVFDGTGVFDGKYYIDNKLATGIYGDKLYIAGVMPKSFLKYKDLMFLNGEKLTGICTSDGKYYEEGLIKELATSKDGKVYSFGVLANGVIKEADGSFNYYIAGIKQAAVDKEVAEFITAPENNIQNVRFAVKEDNSIDFTKFTGVQYLEYAWRDVEYNFTDKDNYTKDVTYAKNTENVGDIKASSTIKDGALVSASFKLGDKEVPAEGLIIDGSKTGIDYAIHFVDIDGMHPNIEITNAFADGLTYAYNYVYDETAKEYKLDSKKIVLGSINDMESGKAIAAYTLDESEEGKLKHEVQKDEEDKVTGVKITDTRTGAEIVQTFGNDGKLSVGTVKFTDDTKDAVSLEPGESCSVKITKDNEGNDVKQIIVKKYDETKLNYIMTIYAPDGTVINTSNPIPIKDEIATALLEKIGMTLDDVQGVTFYEDGENKGKVKTITIDGTEYSVTEDAEKGIITIKSSDTEKRFKTVEVEKEDGTKESKVIITYEKAPSFGGNTLTIERNDNGVQTLYRSENTETGNFTQYEYSETGKLSKATFGKYETTGEGEAATTTFTQTEKTYAADGKTVINTEIQTSVIVKEEGKEDVVTLNKVLRFAGEPVVDEESGEYTNVVYEKSVTSEGYKETNYNSTNGKKISEITVTNATESEPKTATRLDYKADGETVETETITEYKNTVVTKGNKEETVEIETKVTVKDRLAGGRPTEEMKYVNAKDENGADIENVWIKQVTKYTYSPANDTVTSRIVETYSTNSTPHKAGNDTYNVDGALALEVKYNSSDNKKPQSEIVYINGIKYTETTYLSYFETGDMADKVKEMTIDKYNGNICVESVTRTYKEDGTYTEVKKDVSSQFDKDGDEITQAHREFAANAGLTTITDVIIDEETGKLTGIAGTKWGNPTIISSIEEKNGKYSYIEEMTLAENTMGFDNNEADFDSSKNDDVVLRIIVANDVQSQALLSVAGQEYKVNVNGAEVNDNLDAIITTWKIDENANQVYVADALSDNISRERLFTGNSNDGAVTYSMKQYVTIGSLADAKDVSKKLTIPRIEIPNTEIQFNDDGSFNIAATDNKINIQLGSKETAYSIELKQNETFTIAKDGKITSSYKDGNKTVTTTYVFNEDGGYTKTNAEGIGITYSPVWNEAKTAVTEMKITKVKIGDMVIENPTIEDNNVKVSQGENEDGKVQYEILYSLTDGKMTSGKVTFGTGDDAEVITLGSNVTAQFSEDGKSVTIVDKKSNALTVTSTREADGKYTALKLNDKTIDVAGASSVSFNDENNELFVQIDSNSDNGTYGVQTIYYTKAESSKAIGDVKEESVIFPNGGAYKLESNETAVFSEDNKTVEITTKLDENNKVVRQYNTNSALSKLMINAKEITIGDCDVEFLNDSGTVISQTTSRSIKDAKSIRITKEATADALGYVEIYSLEKSDDVAIGDKTSYKLKKLNGTSQAEITLNMTSVSDMVFDDKGGCTVKGVVAGINVEETYDKSGKLTGFKMADKTISIPLTATVEYNETDKTAKVKSTTNPKCELIYDLKTQALKDSKLFGSSTNNVTAGSTVTFNKNATSGAVESVTVKEKDSTISKKYDIAGTLKEMTIGSSSIDVEGATVSAVDTTNNTITVSRTTAPAYNIVYSTTDGKVVSGTYAGINLSAGDIINAPADKGYIAIENGTSLKLYNSSNTTVNLNEAFKLTPSNYKKFLTVLDKFNSLSADKKDSLPALTISNIDRNKISVDGNDISFSASGKNITVSLDTNDNIDSLSITTEDIALSGLETKYSKTVIYDGASVKMEYSIKGVTIEMPYSATAPAVSNKVITFGNANASYVKITIETETTGEGDAAVTTEKIKEIAYKENKTGATEQKADTSVTNIKIWADGVITFPN